VRGYEGVGAVLGGGDVEPGGFHRGVVGAAYYGDGNVADEGEARGVEGSDGTGADDENLCGHFWGWKAWVVWSDGGVKEVYR